VLARFAELPLVPNNLVGITVTEGRCSFCPDERHRPAKSRRLHAVVRGSVQGVGFRATTFDEARRLGLAGWVRNRVDGTVEVLAEGRSRN